MLPVGSKMEQQATKECLFVSVQPFAQKLPKDTDLVMLSLTG